MQEIKISELKPHPKNDYFFDDITGESWDAFLESIRTSGVIEPIVVSNDKTIVSGHQRCRACDELGIDTVLCDVRIYDDEDKLLKDLIETNIRQRGIGNPNPTKFGRCLVELERIYGIRKGSAGKSDPNNLGGDYPTTQKELADMFGITDESLRNYKKLTELIPEIEDLIDTGIVTPTTALAIAKNMKPEEQELFVASMDVTKKIKEKEVKQYIDKIKELNEVNKEHENKLKTLKLLTDEVAHLKLTLKNRPEKEIEIEPSDYQSTKTLLKGYKIDYDTLQGEYDKKVKELSELKTQITSMQSVTPEEEFSNKLKDSTIFFCSRVNEFIEKAGGFIWLTEYIDDLPVTERTAFIKAINTVKTWSENMLDSMYNN